MRNSTSVVPASRIRDTKNVLFLYKTKSMNKKKDTNKRKRYLAKQSRIINLFLAMPLQIVLSCRIRFFNVLHVRIKLERSLSFKILNIFAKISSGNSNNVIPCILIICYLIQNAINYDSQDSVSVNENLLGNSTMINIKKQYYFTNRYYKNRK